MDLILASKSVERAEILENAGIKFRVIVSNYKEDNKLKLAPVELTKFHSLNKAKDVAKRIKTGIVLGFDTVVVLDNKLVGKAKDDKEAINTLKKISTKEFEVVTSFTIIDAKTKKSVSRSVFSRVSLAYLSNKEIEDYVKTGDYKGKAGAFSIKSVGRVKGSKTNVIGLPLDEVLEELKKFGF